MNFSHSTNLWDKLLEIVYVVFYPVQDANLYPGLSRIRTLVFYDFYSHKFIGLQSQALRHLPKSTAPDDVLHNISATNRNSSLHKTLRASNKYVKTQKVPSREDRHPLSIKKIDRTCCKKLQDEFSSPRSQSSYVATTAGTTLWQTEEIIQRPIHGIQCTLAYHYFVRKGLPASIIIINQDASKVKNEIVILVVRTIVGNTGRRDS